MIVGITGTDGSGKGTVVDYLVKEKGFVHYSAREYIVREIKKRNLPVDRKHMRLVGNDLRRQHGNDHIIRECIQKAQQEGAKNSVIESIRETEAAKLIKDSGGVLIAVDADQKLRYERVKKRRSESDQVSFAEFQEHEALEMNDPDPFGMQKQKVIKMADFLITNNGTLDELHAEIEKVLQKIEITQSSLN